MKNKTIFAAVLFLILSLFSNMVYAFEDEEYRIDEFAFDIEEQLDVLEADEIKKNIPDSARQLMEETGISDISVKEMLMLSPKDFFKTIFRQLSVQIKMPLKTLGVITAIALLSALLNSIKSAGWGGAMSAVFSNISVICITVSVAAPIFDCIKNTAEAINDAALFMLSYLPVFTATVVASGKTITATTYNAYLLLACQAISQIVSRSLVPLLSIYLALCIVGSFITDINISSVTGTIKTFVSWALGLLFTVFVGIFSVQTMVSAGADSTSTKAAKFLIGSFIPVVGGALSEAYLAAQGCIGMLRSVLGAYGIIASIFIFLPVFLNVVVWYFVTNLGVIISEVIGVSSVSSMLKSSSNVLSLLIAVILCFALLIIISTTVVLFTAMS